MPTQQFCQHPTIPTQRCLSQLTNSNPTHLPALSPPKAEACTTCIRSMATYPLACSTTDINGTSRNDSRTTTRHLKPQTRQPQPPSLTMQICQHHPPISHAHQPRTCLVAAVHATCTTQTATYHFPSYANARSLTTTKTPTTTTNHAPHESCSSKMG